MHQYVHLDVFTDQPFAGNQLAVFLDAAGLGEQQMQRIANEMAFPETTFVLPPEVPGTDARVRIFTPYREMPMAGHPTIGTTFALAGAGRIRPGNETIVLGLGVGPTSVRLEWGRGGLRFAWMTQPLPMFGPIIPDTAAISAALGLPPDDVAGAGLPVQVVSSGVPFLYIPLNSRRAVDAASVECVALRSSLRAVSLEELPVFVFSVEPADDGATAYSRMFAPGFGIPEDPATGGASGPLGAYLLKHGAVSADTASRFLSLQGVKMGRPSRIHISLLSHQGILREVRVGGEAVIIGNGAVCA